MTARELSYHCVERGGRWLTALGLLGMLGFVGSSVGFAAGAFREKEYLAEVAVSLAVFTLALTVGHLAESFDARRPASPRKTRASMPRHDD